MSFNQNLSRLIQKLRHLIYLIWCNFTSKSSNANLAIGIDVVIPIIEKDLEILPLCIAGLNANINNKIKDIYIVASNSDKIKEFAHTNNLIFVDESTVLGYSPKDINYITTDGLNRSGWIFQQLIKLSAQVGTSRYYLVIDSDHILLKPHTFINEENLLLFYQSSEFHYPYYKMNNKLINNYSTSIFSYVSHKMIFDKEEIKKLHFKIETCSKTSLNWDKIIIASLDTKESSCFSEFELFGNFVDKNKKLLRPWRQKALHKNKLTSYENLQKQYLEFWSVTFPSYLNK
jgi:hypothetical protein